MLRTKNLHEAMTNLAKEAAELAAAAARYVNRDQSVRSRAAARIEEALLDNVFNQKNDVAAVMDEVERHLKL